MVRGALAVISAAFKFLSENSGSERSARVRTDGSLELFDACGLPHTVSLAQQPLAWDSHGQGRLSIALQAV